MLIQAGQTGMILAFATLLFRERATTAKIAGAALALAGALVIITGGRVDVLLALRFGRGDVLIAVAVILWGLYSVLLRRRPQAHALSFLAATLMVGVAFIAPIYALELAQGERIVPGASSALAISYVAVFPSVLAYLCFNRGVELIGAAATGQKVGA
jgi:drug/metabolite transporter (DMT)-like permease